jgi:hypothetical protein
MHITVGLLALLLAVLVLLVLVRGPSLRSTRPALQSSARNGCAQPVTTAVGTSPRILVTLAPTPDLDPYPPFRGARSPTDLWGPHGFEEHEQPSAISSAL